MTANRKASARRLHERAGFEPDAAVALLSLVADFLDGCELPPAQTCAWFIKAVRVMATVEPSENGDAVEHARANALATELGIVRRPGPPPKFVSRRDLRRTVLAYGDQVSETVLSKTLAEAYDVGLSTARKHVKAAKRDIAEARQWFDSLLAANDLESLVQPRGGDCVRP
jgi:hypothetical protein